MCAGGRRAGRSAIERLRPEQELAMLAVLEGRDALVALPTGFGKSLIYQVPAMILDRPTIVVSPLIALMADQERALGRRGVPSSCSTADCAPPTVAPRWRSSTAAAASSSSPRPRRSSRAPRRPSSSVPPGPRLRRRGALHLGVGARLPTVLPAPRRRPRAARQPGRARAHRDRDAAVRDDIAARLAPPRSGS